MPKTAPGPKTSWIPFKGLFAFQRDPVATLKKLATYGDLARMRLALSVFLVSDPELIRQLFNGGAAMNQPHCHHACALHDFNHAANVFRGRRF